MANALSIKVKETLIELKGVLKKTALYNSPKVKMLIEIKKSEVSLSKNELAELIGVSHNSIQSWRTKYIKGGIDELLKDGRGGFKPSLFKPSVHKKIELELNKENASFSSYKQLQAWVEKNWVKGVNYNTLRHYVKRHFGAKLKVPRKSHIRKNEQEGKDFKKTSSKNLKAK